VKVIPSIEITPERLLSSSVSDISANEVAWVSGAPYVLGDVRTRISTGRKYERMIAGAGSVAPELDVMNWKDVGATNKMAMFDLYRNSQTTAPSPLVVSLAPGKRIDALALTGMELVTSVSIVMTVSGVPVYTKTENLNNRSTLSWTDYFFGDFSTKPSLILFDLPLFTGALITITLTSATGVVKCGGCSIGNAVDIGDVEYGAEGDSLNFSIIDRDKFGNATLFPRRSVPKTNQTLIAKKNRVNKIREVKLLLDAVPAVWAGLTSVEDGYFEMLLIVGVWKKFTINAQHPTEAKISLELEEI
jgi:hypothetical protein